LTASFFAFISFFFFCSLFSSSLSRALQFFFIFHLSSLFFLLQLATVCIDGKGRRRLWAATAFTGRAARVEHGFNGNGD
jgi:hypothetical protein